MDAIHFLNVEYIILRLGVLFSNIFGPIWNYGATDGGEASSSFVSSSVWFGLGQFALLGMTLALVLLVLSVYARIKLEIVEHAGFHARDAKYHTKHPEALAETPDVKNPRWQEIMRLSSSSGESDWRRAIMEADILLGEVLEQQGYRGASIGDKLKDANPLQFTTLDMAWKAHKMRNDIVHGGEGFHLSEHDTKTAIDFYRRVFEEFDFI